MPTPAAILERLDSVGYYRSDQPVAAEDFLALMAALGEVKKPTEIRPAGPNRILESGKALPAHNDCNYYAEYVAWYCRDDGGGEGSRTFLVPTAPVLEGLGEADLEALARVRSVLLTHEGGGSPLVRREAGRPVLFYVPWAIQHDGEPSTLDALRRFHSVLKERSRTDRVQGGPIELSTGRFLVIDDRAWFHGRDALQAGSTRHLFRCYVKRH